MDKAFVLRVEKTIKDIKKKLLMNEKLRKLLYYESEDLTSDCEVPTIQLVKDNIFTQPIVEIDVEPPFNKRMFISITLAASGFASANEVDHAIKVSVMAHNKNWTYDDGKIRVLHMMQEVINELDGAKFACAAKLSYEQALQTTIDSSTNGYAIMFGVTDGTGEKEDDRYEDN